MPTKPKKGDYQLTEKEIQQYIDGIYNGSITEKDLSKKVYNSIAKYLEHGVFEGYGMDIKDAYGTDLDLLNSLRENVYMFAAAKDYQMTKDISSLLIGEDGKLRTNKEFNAIARETYSNWNDNWGETEYSTAVGQAYSAQKWNYIEQQKTILPNLRYSAISDPCDICEPFDGMVAPVDDPIWNKIAPLNHFNCRCILVQEDAEVEVTPQQDRDNLEDDALQLMQPLFRSNPGKDGMIFNESHPYFKDVPKEDKPLAKENFNLPLPEPVVQPKIDSYDKAVAAMEKWQPSKPALNAISNYTGDYYTSINKFLRFGEGEIDKEDKKIISDLSYFLNSAPKVEMETYRGLKFNLIKKFEDFDKKYNVGSVLEDKGFMSSSIKREVAENFKAGTELRVFIEVQGKSGVLIEQWSALKREQEVLFNKGTQFKVLSKTKEFGKNGFGEKTTTIKMKIKEL